MPDRQFINQFLKINGISAESSDDDVKNALKRAKWSEEEIATALLILRGDVDDSGIVAVTKHETALYRPDIDLSSRNLSRLLGVDVVVDPALVRDHKTGTVKKRRGRQVAEDIALWTMIFLLSITLALVVAWILLFTMKIGPYRESVPWI